MRLNEIPKNKNKYKGKRNKYKEKIGKGMQVIINSYLSELSLDFVWE